MKQVRKIYDKAFKEKAVQLSYERTNISELAREMGVAAPQLYKWCKELEEFGEGSFPVDDLKVIFKWAVERDILKKAIGIFSKSGR